MTHFLCALLAFLSFWYDWCLPFILIALVVLKRKHFISWLVGLRLQLLPHIVFFFFIFHFSFLEGGSVLVFAEILIRLPKMVWSRLVHLVALVYLRLVLCNALVRGWRITCMSNDSGSVRPLRPMSRMPQTFSLFDFLVDVCQWILQVIVLLLVKWGHAELLVR